MLDALAASAVENGSETNFSLYQVALIVSSKLCFTKQAYYFRCARKAFVRKSLIFQQKKPENVEGPQIPKKPEAAPPPPVPKHTVPAKPPPAVTSDHASSPVTSADAPAPAQQSSEHPGPPPVGGLEASPHDSSVPPIPVHRPPPLTPTEPTPAEKVDGTGLDLLSGPMPAKTLPVPPSKVPPKKPTPVVPTGILIDIPSSTPATAEQVFILFARLY